MQCLKKMKIKLNSDLKEYKKDQVIEITVDKDGTPLDYYWRRRLKDSKIDQCITIVESKSAEKRTTTQKERKL